MRRLSSSRKREKKADGFVGQRIVTLPRPVVTSAEHEELICGLLPTDVGYFPHAANHARERISGIDQAIFIYCTKGTGWCEIDGRMRTVKPGDLLVIPPATPHAYGANRDQPWSIYWFHASGKLLSAFLRELEVSPDQPVIPMGDGTQILSLFEELLAVIEHGYATEQLLCASHTLAHLMVVLIREHRNSPHESPGTRQRIATTIDYMKQHLPQPLQLDALAAIAHLSRSRFVDLFKQQTGYSPIDYFIRLRMQRACRLLDTTAMSVKVIATALGYEDQLYFSRVFRRVNRLTPTQYRNLGKG